MAHDGDISPSLANTALGGGVVLQLAGCVYMWYKHTLTQTQMSTFVGGTSVAASSRSSAVGLVGKYVDKRGERQLW